MNQKVLHKIFVGGFLFLYLLVAAISFCHAVQFFGIGNVMWMSIALAFSFELGLALSLAAILLSDENKKQTLPWILMITLTAVQVVGNVYSVFKYISLSDVEYYQYLAKPLLFFIEEVDENTIQVIVSWIMGAILPIVALMMTDMVASNIKLINQVEEPQPESDNSTEEEPKAEPQVTVDEIKNNLKSSDKDDNVLNYIDILSNTERSKSQALAPDKEKKEEPHREIKQAPKKEVSPVLNAPKKPSIKDSLRNAFKRGSKDADKTYYKEPYIDFKDPYVK